MSMRNSIGLTGYHEISFCTAENINIEEMFSLGLGQRRFEITVEAVLDQFLRERHEERVGLVYYVNN